MASPSVIQETFVDLSEKYEKVCLLLEESKSDPETEPYRSKYVAQKILGEMKTKITNTLDVIDESNSVYIKMKAMLGAVLANLGSICVDTEELAAGEEHLTNCVDTLSSDPLKPEYITILLTALNNLGILWSQRDQAKRSHQYLEKAEDLYKRYKEECNSNPITVRKLFNLSDSENIPIDSEADLEKIYTLTLYYLAQIYSSLNEKQKSALYCHTTLKRQLNTKDFDSVEWALNAASLSQYLMERVGFKEARHHLAAASYILDEYETNLNQLEGNEEELEAKRERFKHRSADVARCWAKYGILLLSNSEDRLMEQQQEEEESNELLENLDEMWFTSLDLSSYEDQVTDKYVLIYDDARKVFLNSQEWLNKAKMYYTLDNHASDCVQIIQDCSQLYKYLAFFEEDEERQCRMQKRRVDLLEPVLKELNPQYYLLVCRELWYELALTYSDILDIKLQRLQSSSERPTPHALRKINHLIDSSITNFQSFIDSLRDSRTSEFPKVIEEDLIRPTLNAYFHIGRLYSKFISPDKMLQHQNVKKTLEAYQFIVDYCEKSETARMQMAVELGVCQDMVQLLPLKLEKLAQAVAH